MSSEAEEKGRLQSEFREDLNNILVCPDCREVPPNLVEEFSSGDMVCVSCGLVVGDRIIDSRSEWRTFANDDGGGEDPSRVGEAANPLLDGSQLETSIAFSEQRNHRQLARLQYQMGQDKTTKALLQAYKEIGALCDAMNVGSKVSNAAKHIFKLVDDNKIMKGKPQEVVVAGCIFIACRQQKVPRTFQEIFKLTSVSKKDIGRIFKQLEAFLQKLNDEKKPEGGILRIDSYEAAATTNAEDLCARFCSQLGFRQAQKVENIAKDLAEQSSTVTELAGRSPLSLAAACIFMASHIYGQPRTAKEIAGVAGVSDGTIRTAYKFLYQVRENLVKKEWLDAYKTSMATLPVS